MDGFLFTLINHGDRWDLHISVLCNILFVLVYKPNLKKYEQWYWKKKIQILFVYNGFSYDVFGMNIHFLKLHKKIKIDIDFDLNILFFFFYVFGLKKYRNLFEFCMLVIPCWYDFTTIF